MVFVSAKADCEPRLPPACMCSYLLLQLLLQLGDDVLLLLQQSLQLLAPSEKTDLRVPRLAVGGLQLLLHPLHLKTRTHTQTVHTHTTLKVKK